VAQTVHGVVDILADLNIALSATGELMVEGVCEPREFLLRDQVVSCISHVLDGAVIKIRPHRAADAEPSSFFEDL